jgi:tetratricopeptide (TPR) repeat protein
LSYPYYAHDVSWLLGLLIVGPWLLVPLGCAGIVLGWQQRRGPFLAWATFIPAYAIGVAIFFVGERYRLPLLVALCIPAGGAIDAALRAWSADQRRQLVPAAVAFVAAAVLTAWPHHLNDGRYGERLRLSKVLMNRGDYAAAAKELRLAHELDPSQTVTEFNLGMALMSAGNPEEGLQYIRHAVDAGVPMPGARYALAGAMLRSGDKAGAAALLRTYEPAPDDTAESCVQVASLAWDAGVPDVAERYLRRAIELRPDWDVPRQALQRLGK